MPEPVGYLTFLFRCAELGLSASISTTWDSAHLVDVDRMDPSEGKTCQYLVRVNSTKRTEIKGRVAIRAVGANPWVACQNADEKLRAIIGAKIEEIAKGKERK